MKPNQTTRNPYQMPTSVARAIALAVMVGILFLHPLCAHASPILPESDDAGAQYLDSMIFFGESTTTHLRARGGLPPRQIWADQSGTRLLSQRTASEPIVDPETGKSLPFRELCACRQPPILVLSFGLNGIMNWAKHPDRYLACYEALIDCIHEVSPSTRILLQTVYPVASADRFSVELDTLCGYIEALNAALPALAAERDYVRIVDTASVLRDANGHLDRSLADTDGIHLHPTAYARILQYLRTHAWQ